MDEFPPLRKGGQGGFDDPFFQTESFFFMGPLPCHFP